MIHAMSRTTDPATLWRTIVQVGSTSAYIQGQLAERGFLVQRRETDKMSERELEAYKKSLRAEADERRKLARDAWRAYRPSHVVHLGEGVFWKDAAGPDRWDLPNAEERGVLPEDPLAQVD